MIVINIENTEGQSLKRLVVDRIIHADSGDMLLESTVVSPHHKNQFTVDEGIHFKVREEDDPTASRVE